MSDDASSEQVAYWTALAMAKAELLDELTSKLSPDEYYRGHVLIAYIESWANKHRKRALELQFPDRAVRP